MTTDVITNITINITTDAMTNLSIKMTVHMMRTEAVTWSMLHATDSTCTTRSVMRGGMFVGVIVVTLVANATPIREFRFTYAQNGQTNYKEVET